MKSARKKLLKLAQGDALERLAEIQPDGSPLIMVRLSRKNSY